MRDEHRMGNGSEFCWLVCDSGFWEIIDGRDGGSKHASVCCFDSLDHRLVPFERLRLDILICFFS